MPILDVLHSVVLEEVLFSEDEGALELAVGIFAPGLSISFAR